MNLAHVKSIHTFKAQEIHMRDPFILADAKRKLYFLFGTTSVCDGAANIDPHFEVFMSSDLINFEGPYAAFMPEKGFWGVKHFWAPEVHEFMGKYYMFVSCKGGIGEDRGTGLLVSNTPEGPYKDYSKGHVTLKGHECLDGTLFIDDEDKPWIVFCHEWTEIFYGKICALPLGDDLMPETQVPITLVDTEKDALPWMRKMHDPRVEKKGYLTDAPFLYRAQNGDLLLMWSSYSIKGYKDKGQGMYAVALARSKTGKLSGPWQHEKELLLDANIGHCSLFHDFNGRLILCGHANDTLHGSEYPVFIPLRENFEGIAVETENLFEKKDIGNDRLYKHRTRL